MITVNGVDHNRPDVVVIEKSERRWTLIDFSVPMDQNVDSKEIEKEGNYSDLAREIRRDYKVHTEIVPVVIGALGTVPKKLAGNLKKLGGPLCDRVSSDYCSSRHGAYPQECAEHLSLRSGADTQLYIYPIGSKVIFVPVFM